LKSLFFIWVGRIIIILVVIFILLSAAAYFLRTGEPPSVKDAPWAIQTYSVDEFRIPSRIYYAEAIEYIDGYPVAQKHWWSFDGKNYKKHSGDKPFPIELYGNIDIRRR